MSQMNEQCPIFLFAPLHCPADRHCLWNRHCHPKYSGHHPGLGHQSHCSSHSCSAACSWNSPSLSSFCVTFFLLLPPHRELVCFVEVYCHCTASSSKLMEMPLLHIKFPTPYNRFPPCPRHCSSSSTFCGRESEERLRHDLSQREEHVAR